MLCGEFFLGKNPAVERRRDFVVFAGFLRGVLEKVGV
jgi:hypothetical protein